MMRRERAMCRALADRVALILATLFGAGYSPVAPGTMGTLVSIPLALLYLKLPLAPRAALLAALLAAACWIAARAGSILGETDDPRIVIDELIGYFVTLFPWGADCSWMDLAAGFAIFRIMDVAKPFPIRWIDRRWKSGAGVVADDAAAGIYALGALAVLRGAWA